MASKPLRQTSPHTPPQEDRANVPDMDAGAIRDLLRTIRFPGTGHDIVEQGLIGRIVAAWPKVEVELLPSGRQGRDTGPVEAAIDRALRQVGFADIRLGDLLPGQSHDHGTGCGCEGTASRQMTPLQAEFLEDGELPEDDLLAVVLGRQDMAERAGYRPGGPDPLAGPRETLDYTCDLAVLQWDINPHDAAQVTRQHEIPLGGWDYRIWWQVHPGGGLLYVSMQAMREDWVAHEGATPHPVGRSEAVNLVYDEARDAVIAIYGTVRDFRPFVKAFSLALATEPTTRTSAEE